MSEEESQELESIELFNIEFIAQVRSFRGQTSGRPIGKILIACSDIMNFKKKLWTSTKQYLKRAIEVDDEGIPKWGTAVEPMEEDLDNFVLFNNREWRKNIPLDCVKHTSVLQNWSNKDIQLYIHEYSLGVSSKSVWTHVQKSLINPGERDRAGM